MSDWQSSITALATAGMLLLAGINMLMNSSVPARASKAMASSSSFWRRHGFAVLVFLAGVAGLFSVLLLPLSPLSVFAAACGAALVAVGMCSVLVLQLNLHLLAGLQRALGAPANASEARPLDAA